MASIIHVADVQDRNGAYQGPKFRQGLKRARRRLNMKIVRRCDSGRFTVLPKRWIVERAIGGSNRCRRLAKDRECLNRNGFAFLQRASVRRRLPPPCQSRE